MRAFEIYLNGKKLCVAGVNLGQLLASIACGENTHGRGGIGMGVTAATLDNEILRWEQRTLHVGDQVRIKIIETETADVPETLQPAPRDSRKYEKAYVRRMAEEFGWTINTGNPIKARKKRESSVSLRNADFFRK